MTEIRTTSSTGGQKGVKPERHDLMPRRALAAIARVFGFGAEKYEDHNWRKGYEWGKSLASLQRHIDSFVDGDTYDEESGLPHLAHAGFHILALLTWLEEQGEGPDNQFDDRWMHSMERARRAKAEAEAADEDPLTALMVWGSPEPITIQGTLGSKELIEALTGFEVTLPGEVDDEAATEAADIVTGQRTIGACATNGVQRSFGEIPTEDLRI